jgi:hypothetical protein
MNHHRAWLICVWLTTLLCGLIGYRVFGQSPPLPPGYVAPAYVVPLPPPFAIAVTMETNVVMQPESASLPLTVGRSNTWYTAEGCQITMSGAAWRPVLRLEINITSNSVAEIECSQDLTAWTTTNIRIISYGEPVRYYITQPVGTRFYRVRFV